MCIYLRVINSPISTAYFVFIHEPSGLFDDRHILSSRSLGIQLFMSKTPLHLQRTAADAGIGLFCCQFYVIPKVSPYAKRAWSQRRTNWLVALVTVTHSPSSIHPRNLEMIGQLHCLRGQGGKEGKEEGEGHRDRVSGGVGGF